MSEKNTFVSTNFHDIDFEISIEFIITIYILLQYSGYGGGSVNFERPAPRMKNNKRTSLIPPALLGSTQDSEEEIQDEQDSKEENEEEDFDDSWGDDSSSPKEEEKKLNLARFIPPSSSDEEDEGVDRNEASISGALKPPGQYASTTSLLSRTDSHASKSKTSGSESVLCDTVRENVFSADDDKSLLTMDNGKRSSIFSVGESEYSRTSEPSDRKPSASEENKDISNQSKDDSEIEFDSEDGGFSEGNSETSRKQESTQNSQMNSSDASGGNDSKKRSKFEIAPSNTKIEEDNSNTEEALIKENVDRKDSSTSGSWNCPTDSVSLKMYGDPSKLGVYDHMSESHQSTSTACYKQDISACYRSADFPGRDSFDQDLESLEYHQSKRSGSGNTSRKTSNERTETSEEISFSRDENTDILPLETSTIHACGVTNPKRELKKNITTHDKISNSINDSWSVSDEEPSFPDINLEDSGNPETSHYSLAAHNISEQSPENPEDSGYPLKLSENSAAVVMTGDIRISKASNDEVKQPLVLQDIHGESEHSQVEKDIFGLESHSDETDDGGVSFSPMGYNRLRRRDTLMEVEELWEANPSIDMSEIPEELFSDEEMDEHKTDPTSKVKEVSKKNMEGNEQQQNEFNNEEDALNCIHDVNKKGFSVTSEYRKNKITRTKVFGSIDEEVIESKSSVSENDRRSSSPVHNSLNFVSSDELDLSPIKNPDISDCKGDEENSSSRAKDKEMPNAKDEFESGTIPRSTKKRNSKLIRKNSISFGELFSDSQKFKLQRSPSLVNDSQGSTFRRGKSFLRQGKYRNSLRELSENCVDTSIWGVDGKIFNKGREQFDKRQNEDDTLSFTTDSEDSFHFVTDDLDVPLSNLEGMADVPEHVRNLLREVRLQLERERSLRESDGNHIKLLNMNHAHLVHYSRDLERQVSDLMKHSEKCKVAAKYFKHQNSVDKEEVTYHKNALEKLKEALASLKVNLSHENKENFQQSQLMAELVRNLQAAVDINEKLRITATPDIM